MIGGGKPYSTDIGATWTLTSNFNWITDATDVPWLAATDAFYESLARIVWEVRTGVDRWVDVNGLGAFAFDSPPRTSVTQHYYSISKGIKQMLMMDARFLPSGAVLMTAQDRPIWRFEPGKLTEQAEWHGPDYSAPIRHGNGVDFASDDPDYVAAVLTGSNSLSISTQGGRENTWTTPTLPTFVHPTDGTIPLVAGNIAISGAGKITWVSTSTGPMKYTVDGGQTWNNPTFRHTAEGSPITPAADTAWHNSYTYRRSILASIKDRPGELLAFCYGHSSGTGTDHTNMAGMWKSTDHGANWLRIRSGGMVGGGADYFHCKLRPVPGNPDHIFWVRGWTDQYPGTPIANGLYFSTNQGASLTTLTGWSEVEDIAFSKNPTANTYPRLCAKGWRGSKTGVWVCDDFNHASPNAATWTLLFSFPGGRPDENCILAADPLRPFKLIVITAGGGFYVYDTTYRMLAA